MFALVFACVAGAIAINIHLSHVRLAISNNKAIEDQRRAYFCKAVAPLQKIYWTVDNWRYPATEKPSHRYMLSMFHTFPIIVDYAISTAGQAAPPSGFENVNNNARTAAEHLRLWTPDVVGIFKRCATNFAHRIGCSEALDVNSAAEFNLGLGALNGAIDEAKQLAPQTADIPSTCWIPEFKEWAAHYYGVNLAGK